MFILFESSKSQSRYNSSNSSGKLSIVMNIIFMHNILTIYTIYIYVILNARSTKLKETGIKTDIQELLQQYLSTF